jgi:hypothetical protein
MAEKGILPLNVEKKAENFKESRECQPIIYSNFKRKI